MSRRWVRPICLSVLTAGSLAVIWALVPASPRVSMSVVGVTAKQWSDEIEQDSDSKEYVAATVELRNASGRAITYWSRRALPDYNILHRTRTGWKEPEWWGGCGLSLEEHVLAPAQKIMFEAVVERDQPCKVSLTYTDGRKPSRFWQRLPGWLTQRLPWARSSSTVTTEVIDLRRSVDLGTNATGTSFAALQAAAQGGDAEAQFRLAGRCWTGIGLDKNVTEALRWYESAATNGHVEAAYNLGAIHEYGLATTSNRAAAMRWYQRASKEGHASAEARLQALAAR